MIPDISIVIPAYNEERYLPTCLESIQRERENSGLNVETVVVLNRCTDSTLQVAVAFGATTITEDKKNIARVRNTGVRASSADVVLTIDADSYFSHGLLSELKTKVADQSALCGGADFRPERRSFPILLSYQLSKCLAKRAGGSMALYWFRRSLFDAIGGFDERRAIGEDIDFSSRLRAYAEECGGRYVMMKDSHVITSCRKFDEFGDWYALRLFLFESARAKSIMDGTNLTDLDRYYYETRED